MSKIQLFTVWIACEQDSTNFGEVINIALRSVSLQTLPIFHFSLINLTGSENSNVDTQLFFFFIETFIWSIYKEQKWCGKVKWKRQWERYQISNKKSNTIFTWLTKQNKKTNDVLVKFNEFFFLLNILNR